MDLSEELNSIHTCIIKSFESLLIKKHGHKKDAKLSKDRESLEYMSVKIEVLTKAVLITEFQSLDDFLKKVITPIIELYVSYHFIFFIFLSADILRYHNSGTLTPRTVILHTVFILSPILEMV